MNRKNLLFKINFLVFIFSLFMLIIVISCGGGGGGGGGILPPIGGGSGDSTGTPNISFNNQGYLIIETKSDSLNTNSLSFNFQTVSPNILANQNSEPLRNINNNIREYKCGFKPSNKNQFNQNIYYSTNPPSVDAMKSFTVIDDNTNTTVTVNAKCVYVNNNLKYAIWVDINNADNYDEEALFNANQSNIISHFNNDYNTLTTNIDSLNFYVDILITEKIDSNSDPSVIGYFWGAQDLQRVNVHPFTFSLNYGTYNEFNVTLAHEFVHLLEYNKTKIGNHEAWIAEGLATYGEALCGYFGNVRINSIISFFNNPKTTPLVTNNPDFANYGKSFLFIKQLDQRFTNAWSNMVISDLDGINLIENINGQEDFQTTVDKFNIAVLIDTNDNNPTYDFRGINLNSSTFNNGVYRYNGWNNTTLNRMGAAGNMSEWSAYYLYKNSAFNGNILVNGIQLLFNDFDFISNSWSMKYNDFNNNVRFIVVYR
ncbi:MAG: hypothetical protein ACP5O4_05175 [bacterium]